MEKEYNCQIYYPLKAFAYSFLIWVLFMALSASISIGLNIKILFPIAFVFSITVPLLFMKKIKSVFSRKVALRINDIFFSLIIYKLNSNEKANEVIYRWDSIKAYKFDFTPSKFTVLDIYFKMGGSKKFIFLDDKNEDQSIHQESVFSVFRYFVNLFNKNKDTNETITVSPGFLTTSAGTFILYIPGILIVIAIILHVKYNSSNYVGFLILGIFSFIPLLVKRKMQKKMYERMSNLNNNL